MKPFPAPEGFVGRSVSAGSAWFRASIEKPVCSAWARAGAHLRLSEVTRRHPQSTRHPGRVPVYSAPFPGTGTLVVRPCAHGGWGGLVARDLYLGPERVRREIRVAARLHRMKIPTPEIVAVLFYPAGPCFRMEVVSHLIPSTQDLVQRLNSRPGPGERARIFSSVRKLFDQLYRQGVRHADLNARNILLSTSGPSTAWLLDVDAIRFEDPLASSVDTANRHRLLRSLLKRARLGDLGWSETEVARLWRELFPRP